MVSLLSPYFRVPPAFVLLCLFGLLRAPVMGLGVFWERYYLGCPPALVFLSSFVGVQMSVEHVT